MPTDFSRPTEVFAPSGSDIAEWNGQIDRLRHDDGLESTMKRLACLIDESTAFQINCEQRNCCRKALDWLQTLKTRLEKANDNVQSIKGIELVTCCSDADGNPIQYTAHTELLMFNTKTISEAEIEELIRSGRVNFDPRVVMMQPSQAANLFPDMYISDKEDTDNE